MPNQTRVKVACIFRRGDQILVSADVDSVKQQEFYNPPGGGIDFGEYSADAARREMREELDVDLYDLQPLGVLENVFEYEGEPGHDVVFIIAARLGDATMYERDEIAGIESDGRPYVARWMSLSTFGPGGSPLYPTGLFELLGTP
jgi:ADP-ribose pyrophosphatase YjhB (NUDIX family)